MKQKRGKQILKIEKKLKQWIRAALIPHAGRLYAGHARYAALRYFKKNTKQIIYLATLHNINKTNNTYILHRDKGFRLGTHNFIHTNKKEHSFDWVHDELKDLLPSAKILALGANEGVTDLHNWIINYLRTHKNAIFIATIDLIHYGKKFHNTGYLSYPQQMDKVKKEELLITAALSPNAVNNQYIDRLVQKDGNIVDGSKTLEIFMKVMTRMGWIGRVADYYDSHGSNGKSLIDRYTIDTDPVENLVSYVSIIYGNKAFNELLPVDILLAIGLLKSIIMKETFGKTYSLRLPNWSPLNKRKGGVFVGTSRANRTTCSYGRYEDAHDETTGAKIIQAAHNCPKDAATRWNSPYTPQNIHNLSYKVEFLDPIAKWKSYPGYLAPKKFKNDGTMGIFLRLPNGNGATYLPSVFRDNPQWSINKIMDKLAQKAGGHTHGDTNDWKKGEIKTYKTTSYTWDNGRKRIIVVPAPPVVRRGKSNTQRIRKKYHKKNNTRRKK